MVKLVNRARMSTSTTGTGTITLGSAENGYQSFDDAGVPDGDVVRYVIEDGANWEVGTGTYTASGTTLTRSVTESSNSDAALNLSGSAIVFIGPAAQDFSPTITLAGDASGSVTLTDLEDATLTVTVADDSHNHTIANVDNLQTNLDAKLNLSGGTMTGNIVMSGSETVDGRDLSVDGAKLDGIEANATADQSNAEIQTAVASGDLDMGSNNITTTGKVLFANVYSNIGDLPSASTYHGMFAHVHSTGKGYFAHGGNWYELVNEDTSGNVTMGGNLTVSGDLTVSGTTTTVNTETINLADNQIVLNSNYTGSSPTENGGIEIERGTLTNKTLVWDETNDKWTVGTETFVSGDHEVTGNITVSGTVDGRDVATDGTKLDGIEANADVTDTTNVTAAGALMDSEVTNLAQVKAFDSSDYATAAQGTTADAALARSGGQMTGNITMSGSQTVDGRDLSVDGAKLDGIESGATADQTKSDIDALGIAASTAGTLATARNIAVSGAVTGNANFDGSGDISISTTATSDPTLTLSGDASGSATFTNLGNATLTVTVADDSHNHVISNIDGLQSALDGKQASGTYNTIIGTDSDINTSGSTIIDNIFVTDGVITSMGTRTLTLADLGYTGATNANYITNNNQLTNGAGYTTNVGDITGVTAGTNLTGGGTSGSVTLNVSSSPTFSGVVSTESLQEDYDALSGTSPAPDADNAGAFSLTMTGNTTFTFGSVTSGRSVGFILQLTGNGSTVTWPSSVKWAGGTAPDAPASGETDLLVFWTRDGGTNWYGSRSIDAAA